MYTQLKKKCCPRSHTPRHTCVIPAHSVSLSKTQLVEILLSHRHRWSAAFSGNFRSLGKLPECCSLLPTLSPAAWPEDDWWFSPVATISDGDTLIEPHCFQVCGTLQGHCAGGSCVFNYCLTEEKCNMSCSSVNYHPLPVWPQAKPIGLSPRSWYAAWKVCEPHCGPCMCSGEALQEAELRGGPGDGRSML